jgi:hypothetical protein
MFVRPIIEYCNTIDDSCTQVDSNKLEALQFDAARTVTGAKRGTSHQLLIIELGWQTLSHRRCISKSCKMYQIVNKSAPHT